MEKNIKAQRDANKHGLDWARIYLKNTDLAKARENLIKNRIQLKRVARAKSVNPAAAVFGESQVGKSYMVDCLLKSKSGVLDVYDGNGNATGFVEAINPLGGGKEATGLITRFTIKKVWEDPEYPIRVELLSPIDVVMVLVDTYFNDVENQAFPNKSQIEEKVNQLLNKYKTSANCQDVITEDEIFELKEYFDQRFLKRGEIFLRDLKETRYFEILSLVIQKISVDNWAEELSFLWNNEQHLTNVFGILLNCYKSLDFAKTVYIKMDAVLREPGTLLHVDRIYELFELENFTDDHGNVKRVQKASEPRMDVLTDSGKKVSGIMKSEFCAIAMEVDFTITKEGENSEEGIVVEKPFLEKLDILDFPGARSRKLFNAGSLSVEESCEMLLRGKVAYLFNKYSQQFLISNLLFCHHSAQSNVTTLASLLKGWISTTVGNTAAQRTDFMQKAGGVPPLFLIGTKFNMDLVRQPIHNVGSESAIQQAIDGIWQTRFDNLQNILGQNKENDWMTNWVVGKPFQNVFLLRAYDYSCQSGVFVGYQTQNKNGVWELVYNNDGTLQGETGIAPHYKTFIESLKDSFIKNDFVKQHFEDPSYSWVRAIGDMVESKKTAKDGTEIIENKWVPQDGSDYIIENLTKSGSAMEEVRNLQFSRILTETFNSLVETLHKHYHDDNADEELRKQMKQAGHINLTFDALFGQDKYFFSDFISSLIIEEERLHDIVLDVVNDTKIVDKTDLSMLFAIRAKAKIDPTAEYEENVNKLITTYNCTSRKELEQELARLSKTSEDPITIDAIINPPRVKNLSLIIANAIVKAWIDVNLSLERYKDFVNRGLKEDLLESFLKNLKTLFDDKIQMSERMASRIHPYVSSAVGTQDEMSDMIADICSEMINKFINTVGSAYYDEELWNDIEATVKYNKFDLNVRRQDATNIEIDTDEIKDGLPAVFDSFDNIDVILNQVPVDMNRLAHFSNYQEYSRWIENMKISFLATTGIPKYDIATNDALRKVLVDFIVKQEALKELVDGCEALKSLRTQNAN